MLRGKEYEVREVALTQTTSPNAPLTMCSQRRTASLLFELAASMRRARRRLGEVEG